VSKGVQLAAQPRVACEDRAREDPGQVDREEDPDVGLLAHDQQRGIRYPDRDAEQDQNTADGACGGLVEVSCSHRPWITTATVSRQLRPYRSSNTVPTDTFTSMDPGANVPVVVSMAAPP